MRCEDVKLIQLSFKFKHFHIPVVSLNVKQWLTSAFISRLVFIFCSFYSKLTLTRAISKSKIAYLAINEEKDQSV